MRLETPRLLLRDPIFEDIELSARMYCDPEITKYVGGPRDYEAMKAMGKQEVEAGPQPYAFWSVVEKSTHLHIGDAGLIQKEVEGKPEVELNYYFQKTFWGKGYGSEIAEALVKHAFETLHLDRVIALIHQENAPSRRVAEKVGFHVEKNVVTAKGNPRLLYSIQRMK